MYANNASLNSQSILTLFLHIIVIPVWCIVTVLEVMNLHHIFPLHGMFTSGDIDMQKASTVLMCLLVIPKLVAKIVGTK